MFDTNGVEIKMSDKFKNDDGRDVVQVIYVDSDEVHLQWLNGRISKLTQEKFDQSSWQRV